LEPTLPPLGFNQLLDGVGDLMVNIYIVNTQECIEVEGQYQKSVKVSHRYVVASSFESALETVRRHHAGVEIKGISLQNHTNGQKVLFSEAIPASV
jgi:hypothetical protein